jgi:hypothetical protein
MRPHNINKTPIIIIVIVSALGLLFSGYLALAEFSGQGISCGIVREMLRIPACVYGFVMYAIIFTFALAVLLNLKSVRKVEK